MEMNYDDDKDAWPDQKSKTGPFSLIASTLKTTFGRPNFSQYYKNYFFFSFNLAIGSKNASEFSYFPPIYVLYDKDL